MLPPKRPPRRLNPLGQRNLIYRRVLPLHTNTARLKRTSIARCRLFPPFQLPPAVWKPREARIRRDLRASQILPDIDRHRAHAERQRLEADLELEPTQQTHIGQRSVAREAAAGQPVHERAVALGVVRRQAVVRADVEVQLGEVVRAEVAEAVAGEEQELGAGDAREQLVLHADAVAAVAVPVECRRRVERGPAGGFDWVPL